MSQYAIYGVDKIHVTCYTQFRLKHVKFQLTMRAFLIVLVILKWLVLLQEATAHDAFYPHHGQDVSPAEVERRKDLRVTVLVITLTFTVLMAILISFVFSKMPKVGTTQQENDQQRLNQRVNQAMEAALHEIATDGTASRAISAALSAYASNMGVSWHQQPITGDRVRCKIGSDVVIVKVDAQQIEMQASSKDTSTQAIQKLT